MGQCTNKITRRPIHWLLALFVLGTAGCQKIHVYGDSLIDGPTGKLVSAEMQDLEGRTMFPVVWEAETGATIGGHSIFNRVYGAVPYNPGAFFDPDSTVFVLGTEDAKAHALGTLSLEKSMYHSWLNFVALMEAASDAGTQCILLVSTRTDYDGPPDVATGPDRISRYREFVSQYNTVMREITECETTDVDLKIADWGAAVDANPTAYTLADGITPNEAGATLMGQLIRKQLDECPPGRWLWWLWTDTYIDQLETPGCDNPL